MIKFNMLTKNAIKPQSKSNYIAIPLSISSNNHTERSSQNSPGHQQHRQQEHHHRGGWKQTSPWRWDHRRAGPHRVLDERRQGEEEQRGSSVFTSRHAQTHVFLPLCVNHSIQPLFTEQHKRGMKHELEWEGYESPAIVAALPSSCCSTISCALPLSLILSCVVGGGWGRGKGPSGDEEDPEQLRNWGGDERGWGPLLHHGD